MKNTFLSPKINFYPFLGEKNRKKNFRIFFRKKLTKWPNGGPKWGNLGPCDRQTGRKCENAKKTKPSLFF